MLLVFVIGLAMRVVTQLSALRRQLFRQSSPGARWFASSGAMPKLLPASLPELRACFVEQKPLRMTEAGVADCAISARFDAISKEALDKLARESDSAVETVLSDKWFEAYSPVSADDTVYVGLRAQIVDAGVGLFEHHFVAWSRAQAKATAHGGVAIACRCHGMPVPIPDRWVYRMEVDFGDSWASVKILEFRRAVGLPSNFGLASGGIDDELL